MVKYGSQNYLRLLVGMLAVSGLLILPGVTGTFAKESPDGFSTIPSSAGPLAAKRTFEFTYRTTIQVPDTGSAFSLHVPMPEDSPWQTVRTVSLGRSMDPVIYYDSAYGNKILRYDFDDTDGRRVTIEQTYRIHRIRRYGRLDTPTQTDMNSGSYYRRYLNHHQYMRTNERIKKIAREVRESRSSYSDRLRGLYDRVRDMMTYDKSGRGWGRGDIRYCLRVGKGNCTDFHTLFASIAREMRVPSRFLMGFPVPRTREEGTIGGYHCWVESYVPNRGWFPMDISEADKHPDLVEFYFGTLDADRVLFTRGKNVPLSNGKLVNYLVYPKATGNSGVSIRSKFMFQNVDT